MPEWAELKKSADFINKVANDKIFINIEKSDVSKVNTDLSFWQNKKFTISAESRGKELRLKITQDNESKYLLMFMGMSGGFALVSPKYADFEKIMKHSHLRFYLANGKILCFHDIRRFGKWKWADNWSSNRGFDPVSETTQWKQDLKTNHTNIKGMIFEVLMDQRWFSGVGNYLRAEIMYRTPVNPFMKIADLDTYDFDLLLEMTIHCMERAYFNQGGTIIKWINSFNDATYNATRESMQDWVQCYGKSSSSFVTDKGGRVFWFESKWNDKVPEKTLKKKHRLI